MAISTIEHGTNVALILCALLCMPPQEADNQARSLIQANTCLNHVLYVLVAKDTTRLKYQAKLCKVGFYEALMTLVSHNQYKGSADPHEMLAWCHDLFSDLLYVHREPSASDTRKLQEKLSAFSRAIVNIYQVMGLLGPGDRTYGLSPGPIHPMFLAIACQDRSSELRIIYERLLPRSGFPTQAQCLELLALRSSYGDTMRRYLYPLPPLLIFQNIFQSQELDPYLRHIAATQMWFFVYYFRSGSQHQSTLLRHWWWDEDEEEEFTPLVSDNFAESLETFILSRRDQDGTLGTYSHRVAECILQARRQKLGERFSVEDQELLAKVENQLQGVPLRYRGLNSLSPPPTSTTAQGAETTPTEILPREPSPIAPSIRTLLRTAETSLQFAEVPQDEVGHVALELQSISPLATPITGEGYTSSATAPTAGAVGSEPPSTASHLPGDNHSMG